MSGKVFHEISEGIMAQSLKLDVKDARDSASIFNKYIKLEKQKQYGKGTVPDVIGLGARDAVYQMESRGIRTQIYGRGKVVKQTLIPGTLIKKGATCSITLE